MHLSGRFVLGLASLLPAPLALACTTRLLEGIMLPSCSVLGLHSCLEPRPAFCAGSAPHLWLCVLCMCPLCGLNALEMVRKAMHPCVFTPPNPPTTPSPVHHPGHRQMQEAKAAEPLYAYSSTSVLACCMQAVTHACVAVPCRVVLWGMSLSCALTELA